MYWADRHRFTNYQARRRQVLRLRAALAKSPYDPDPQIDCCQMEYAYQWTPAHLASYPLMFDDPDVRARDFVMISCANATKDGVRSLSLCVCVCVSAAPSHTCLHHFIHRVHCRDYRSSC